MIYITVDNLRMRILPSTKSKSLGFALKGKHNYSEKKYNEGYCWYHIEDGWVANVDCIIPLPVKQDTRNNQVFVSNVVLNIRTQSNIKSDKVGVCEKSSFYNVLEIEEKSDFTWYKIADRCWIAGIEEVEYIPKGSAEGKELKEKIKSLRNSLELLERCIDKQKFSDLYEETLTKVNELINHIDSNYDDIDYDFIVKEEYDEIDFLNTTDVHGAWKGYDENGNYNTPKFSYNDVGNYRDKLESQGIKTYIIDCGDWSRPCRVELVEGKDAIDEMTENGYLLSTSGNHEWKWLWGEGASKSIEILSKLKCMTACNILKDGKEVFKPYRAVKVGSKKIAIIGVAYPSPNGFGTLENEVWKYDGYEFLDGSKLYKQVQKYIDMFKGFDYIFVACHMDKETEESLDSDKRSLARSDLLVKNTSGLTGVMQGHYNYQLNSQIVLDKNGNKVLICYDAGSNLDCFGRIRLRGTNVSSTLITERSQL